MSVWISVVFGAAVITGLIAALRRKRAQRTSDPWPAETMGDLIEFDTVRISRLIGSAESHSFMSDARRLPATGDEGTVLDWVQNPTGGDPLARIIVEGDEWLAVFRRDELELVSRPSRKPLAG